MTENARQDAIDHGAKVASNRAFTTLLAMMAGAAALSGKINKTELSR